MSLQTLQDATTVESPLFVRSTVFDAHDCAVEVIRSGGGGQVLAIVVVARKGVSVTRVEPPRAPQGPSAGPAGGGR